MGGEVLSAFLQALFQTAINLLQEELKLQHGLEEERKKLVTTVSMIQAVLSEAEERQHTNGPLRLWLNVLRDVAYDAVDVLDEIAYEAQRCQLVSLAQVRHSLSLVNPKRGRIRHVMSDKIKDISQRLDVLQKQRVTFDLRVVDGGRHQLGGDELPASTSLNPPAVFGRDNDKHRILEMLLRFDRMCQKSISVIPIIGIYGVGKTTLAQVVYNDEAVEKQFEVRLWVDVSHDFNVKRLTKAIIESIDNSPVVDHISLDSLQKQLQKKLSGKRYLLVLDNVWNETTEEWQRLRLPLLFGAEGSKVLVTTRSEEVAKIMGTTRPYMLNGLSDADCWTLFCQYALGQNPYQHSDIDDIKNEILKECKGLPLAAISKGNQLHRENDRSKWRSIVESERQEFSDYGSELGRAISLIYQQLPARLKPCLAYCSIFPKGHEFEKELIVQLWMAQNLIQSQGEHGEHVEDLGSRYIDFLVKRSLIECSQFDYKRGKQKYRVREFAHDFVQHVSGEECSIVEIGESSAFVIDFKPIRDK